VSLETEVIEAIRADRDEAVEEIVSAVGGATSVLCWDREAAHELLLLLRDKAQLWADALAEDIADI
jgi:hypothetical protein